MTQNSFVERIRRDRAAETKCIDLRFAFLFNFFDFRFPISLSLSLHSVEMASISGQASAKPSKKRKHVATVPDSRFEFSAEDLAPDALAGPSHSSPSDNDAIVEEASEEENDEEGEAKGLPVHLLPKSGKKHGTPGLIYFSRLPPGMGPAQIKHLLSAYGEVGRVFLARASKFLVFLLRSRTAGQERKGIGWRG